jgi:hypothetical protein
MTPNPKTGRYLYGLYVITQRTPDQSNLSPSPGEFSMEPYDIGRDHRPLCIKLEMLQYLWTPKYSNTATLPEKMVKLAYDRFGT